MPANQTIKGKVVCEYLEQLPDWPSRSIARKLLEEQPALFHSLESARDLVRAYRGQHGEAMRKRFGKHGQHYRPAGSVTDGHIPLPPPLPHDRNAWKIVAVDFKRALVLSDIHVPYHDQQACLLALNHGRQLGVDCIIINGDLCDFHSISDWERDPRRRHLIDELQTCRRFLEVLRETFPKARIIFKEGNHEERLPRYINKRVPEFAEIEGLGMRDILFLDDYGIELVDNRKPIRTGPHLHILHGHEFQTPFTNPVNPARGLFLRAKCNAIAGHLHQTTAHTASALDRIISCWSTGCLCDLHPLWKPMNEWTLGFATIELNRQNWRVQNHKIINGSIV